MEVKGNMLKKMNKRGVAAINFLRASVISLVVAIITLTIGLNVNNTVTDTMTTGSAAANASALGTTGLAVFADYWSVIAIVIVLAVIIGLFGMFGSGQR